MSLRPAGVFRTDQDQLTMMRAYLREGLTGMAVFEFFVRRLPPTRNFLIAAGLEQCLDFLENLSLGPAEMERLAASGQFDAADLADLATIHFDGDVDAMPEGTAVFPGEPILRVAAPLPVAQVVETQLVNLLHFQTLIASKAARMVLAARGRRLADLGCRRAHGTEAALLAARAAYVAGFSDTATTEAGIAFGIPLSGAMTHSFIQAHASEEAAFLSFARSRPENLVLLIDTYDTERAAHIVAGVAPTLAAEGIAVQGVRIDSGDLGMHASRVRTILDRAGQPGVSIFASGGLDENAIAALIGAGAPIDAFGVGSSLATSADAPALDCAYKLQEYDGVPRRKLSEDKATWPGRKQVFRTLDPAGVMADDVLTLADDAAAGEPLLQAVMRAGRRLAPPESLSAIRARTAEQLRRLPPALRGLQPAPPYPVRPSWRLHLLTEQVDQGLRWVPGAVPEPQASAQSPSSARWEHFPHGADIGVRGIGPTFESALEQAALALAAIVANPDLVRPDQEIRISCPGGDDDDILYQWLNGLIYEMAARRLVLGRFSVSRQNGGMIGRAWGEPFDSARHQPRAEPKGATYTALSARRRDGGEWVAQCVVDV